MKDEENENREQETVFNNQCSTCNLATFAGLMQSQAYNTHLSRV